MNAKGYEQATTEINTFLTDILPEYYRSLKKEITDARMSFIEIFQLLGNYIHESGFDGSEHHPIIRLINYLIKYYRYKEGRCHKKY